VRRQRRACRPGFDADWIFDCGIQGAKSSPADPRPKEIAAMDTLHYPDEALPVTTKEVARDEAVSMWGGIMAGVFLTKAVLILLAEIGIAVGLSAFEPGDRAAAYVIGAGVFGLIATVLAFFLGGMASSYLSRTNVAKRAIIQGALVWVVAVPVIAFLGAVLALGTTTAAAASAAAAAAATAREPVAARPTPGEVERAAAEATKPENVDRAAAAGAGAAWTMVGGLLLGLGAAALGGRVGTRKRYLLLRSAEGRVVQEDREEVA
jgi:hypothetical protein